MTTTIFPRPEAPLTFPGLTTEGEDSKAPQVAERTRSSSDGIPPLTTLSKSQKLAATQHRILSQDEWVQVCRGIGVIRDDESTAVIRPTSWLWPPKGFPDGLYQDVIWQQSKFNYFFHILACIKWTLMILQVALNAVLTALGSLSFKDGITITTVAGLNTLFAGILAMMHNSGLPDRYRFNRDEFAKIEEDLKQIVDTRLVLAGDSVTEVMATCYSKFADARQSVHNNYTTSYVPATATTPSKALKTQSVAEAKS